MEKKRLEFYGGPWMSFLPFIIFIALIILTTFVWQSISDGALWVPAFAAILITFFFAKDKKQYATKKRERRKRFLRRDFSF